MQLERTGESGSNTLGINILKTVAQTALIWGIFLWLIPLLIIRVEMIASIPNYADGTWSGFGLLLFMASATLFVICAANIVWIGRGTPWPWDKTTGFVIAGPYRYVRNPIVLSGVGLGLSSSFIFGSYLLLIYVMVGVVAWNFVFRAVEEADLASRFGQPYVDYRISVNSYVPKSDAYRALVIRSSFEEPEA